MSQTGEAVEELDDWEVLCSFLPAGWEEKAREYGALVRARQVADASALLRVLLIHLAAGCSLGGDLRAGAADGVRGTERHGGV